MLNEHLILKAFGHIICNWQLIVWLLGQLHVMWVFKSINLKSLFRISISIYQRSISKDSSIKICSNLKISWVYLESSEVLDLSSEVPDLLRKFRTFFGSSEHLRKFRTSAEVPDFESLKSQIQNTPSSSLSQNSFSIVPAPPSPLPSPPPSKSHPEVLEALEVWFLRSGRPPNLLHFIL